MALFIQSSVRKYKEKQIHILLKKKKNHAGRQ